MATPIFSNSVIGEVFEKENTRVMKFNANYNNKDIVMLNSILYEDVVKAIRKYFYERKCAIDKTGYSICEQCFEDNNIEKDLIGVFVIAK